MREPDPRLKRIFLSVAFRHGRNPGKIPAARQLLDLIYYMLRKDEDYRAPGFAELLPDTGAFSRTLLGRS